MTKKQPFSRRELLAGAGALGIGAVGTGYRTYAALSDSETAVNRVTAGTLNLTTDGDNRTVTLDIGPVSSGETTTETVPIQNQGTVTKPLSLEIAAVKSGEGKNFDNETNTDTSDGGELGQYVDAELGFYRDGDLETSNDRTVCIPRQNIAVLDTLGRQTTGHQLGPSAPSSESNLYIKLWIGDLDNSVSGDRVEFDVAVTLGGLRTVEEWRTYRKDLFRTGTAPNAGGLPTASKPSLSWRFKTDTNTIECSPSVVDGIVYFGDYNGNVYALDAESKKLHWKYTEPADWIFSSPIIENGTVYVGSIDGSCYAIEAGVDGGSKRWQFTTGRRIKPSPAVVDGTVYFGSSDNFFYAVDADTGGLEWKEENGREIWSSPAVSDGKVFFGSNTGKIYAYSLTGTKQWENFAKGNKIRSTPTITDQVFPEKTVIVGGFRGGISAYDLTGTKRWVFDADTSIDSSPAVRNGVVYFGGRDGKVYAVDLETGEQLQRDGEPVEFQTGDTITFSSPAVIDETVYIASLDSNVYALNTGNLTEQWRVSTDGSIHSSPAVVDGALYIGSDDGYVYKWE